MVGAAGIAVADLAELGAAGATPPADAEAELAALASAGPAG